MKKTHILILLLAAAILLFSACGDDDNDKGMTYSSSDTPMEVPGDASATNSYITVSGGPTSISKITVTVDIPHTNTMGLLVQLFGPTYTSGTNGGTQLAYMAGSNGVDGGFVNVVFDDNASTGIMDATMPAGGFTGTFKPELSFHTFLGTDANGQWRLLVQEVLSTSVNGQIRSWSITFE